MQKQKKQKPFVIFDPNALIKPNTMVIELFNTVVAYFAVLGPCWFFDKASRTFVVFAVHNVVKSIFFPDFTGLFGVFDYAGVIGAGPIEAIITYKHQNRACVNMPTSYKNTRTINHHAP
jgi:hypothetical protein